MTDTMRRQRQKKAASDPVAAFRIAAGDVSVKVALPLSPTSSKEDDQTG